MTYVGYFYDINLFVIMRFGFSDPHGNVWFEARYASFLSRFKPIIEYNVQRCDVGAVGRPKELYEVKELWWSETYWRCVVECQRLFNLVRKDSPSQVREKLVPPSDFGLKGGLSVSFNGFVVPTFRGKITGTVNRLGTGFRQVWNMSVQNLSAGLDLAGATQHFVTGPVDQDMNVISHWRLNISTDENYLPHWVVAFMAVLDDIEED
eukprot:TRINITY_DN51880_c0_g1_i1.p1 TRINITY_DN51880_c0_g1~~TRINITY_DN51880_c0_g1_i1.p1  ORF type:complete len:230 (-),score=27.23 TRINITY_DN51880_c0_g1_i1:129-749(-)